MKLPNNTHCVKFSKHKRGYKLIIDTESKPLRLTCACSDTLMMITKIIVMN